MPKGSRTEGEKGREKTEGHRGVGQGSQKTGCCKQERDEEQDNCVDRGEQRGCARKQGQRDGGINKRDREQEAEGTSRTTRQRKDKGRGKTLQ